jgi:hypothetical protein
MLLIKKTQVDSFEFKAFELFIARTKEFVFKELDEKERFETDKKCEEYINDMILFARNYEIESELNIQKLIYMNLKLGLVIPAKDFIKEILSSSDRDEDFKVKRIYEFITGINQQTDN